MLSTRNPTLMLQLFTNFDFLFNVSNMLTASLCLSASFGFDERAAAFLLVPVPIFALIVMGDASMSDVDFELRQGGYLLKVLYFVSGNCVVEYSSLVVRVLDTTSALACTGLKSLNGPRFIACLARALPTITFQTLLYSYCDGPWAPLQGH